ncbi:MAG: DUF1592 domain-containing protein [Planctomycetes bacterium]|nr:DUF1592 domain-containing protein [Planctomycetota bacterium]
MRMPQRPLFLLMGLSAICVLTGASVYGLYQRGWLVASNPSAVPSLIHANQTPDKNAIALIHVYCGTCHQSGRSGVDFDDTTLPLNVMRGDRSTWEMVVEKLREGKMPPKKFPQPLPEERAFLIQWVENVVLKQDINSPADGRLMARRLQQTEYVNAIRDLLGFAPDDPGELPNDEKAWGQVKGVPALPAEELATYRAVARKLLDQALSTEFLGIDAEADDDSEGNAAADPENPGTRTMFFRDFGEKTSTEAAREVLGDFARRAYRRPLESSELDQLIDVFEASEAAGGSFDEAIYDALEEILTSPNFLYRVEVRHGSEMPLANTKRVQQLELASRLSFFLWKSVPDEQLLSLAEQGTLSDNLESQVKRMLQSPKSQAMATDFTDEWLNLKKLPGMADLDDSLRTAMRQETQLLVSTILRENRSLLEFLDADYTFLNEKLANHYGIKDVAGDEMRKVSVKGTHRGGLVTHGSIHAITSNGLGSSPVQRGKWVLDNLLGTPPPRPPAGLLEAFNNAPKANNGDTKRTQMEKHRQDPNCAQCHVKMDAIGLALENFDGLGAWRTEWNTRPVDASGILPDGKTIRGPAELKTYLRGQQRLFARALAQKMLGYALGRKLTADDRPAVDQIALRVTQGEFQSSALILEVIRSTPFQNGWNLARASSPKVGG